MAETGDLYSSSTSSNSPSIAHSHSHSHGESCKGDGVCGEKREVTIFDAIKAG